MSDRQTTKLCHVGAWGLVVAGFVMVGYAVFALARERTIPEAWFVFIGIGAIAVGARLPEIIKFKIGSSGVEGELPSPGPSTTDFTTTSPPEETDLDDFDEQLAAARYLAGTHALTSILGQLSKSSPDCQTALYLLDADSGELVPVHVPYVEADSKLVAERWRPGRGATGTAWTSGEFVFAEGDAVVDETYGVTSEQAQRFRSEGLTAVAATPVLNSAATVLAVISLATAATSDRGTLTDADSAFAALAPAALATARVLIELLEWFNDDYTPD